MTLRHFSASINVLSPTCCETKLVANIDPNLPLPQSLLDLITRKMCGIVFHKLQRAANKIAKDPVKNPHAQRMRQEKEFYEGWLLPKFQAYSELSNWKMPKVSALELSEEDQEKEFELIMSHQDNVRAHNASRQEDDASTSSVSRLTIGSALTRNPIGRYLREIEAKDSSKEGPSNQLGSPTGSESPKTKTSLRRTTTSFRRVEGRKISTTTCQWKTAVFNGRKTGREVTNYREFT